MSSNNATNPILLCSLVSDDPSHKQVNDSLLKQYKNHCKAIIAKGSQKLMVGRRIRLISEENHYDLHVLAEAIDDLASDSNAANLIIFCAITSQDFSVYFPIGNLLKDFRVNFYNAISHDKSLLTSSNKANSLNKLCLTQLNKLFSQYNSPNNNPLLHATNQVNAVKSVMRDNVEKALSNVEQLEEMESKSELFQEQAKLFDKSSSKVKSMMRCKYIKVSLIVIILVVAIVAYIIYSIVQQTN